MVELSKTQTLIANERLKAISGVFFNLVLALTITVVVRIYGIGTIDLTAVGWTFIDGMLIFIGYKVLVLLKAEE